MTYAVHEKLIISGSVVEHYQYEKPYYVGFPQLWRAKKLFKRLNTEFEQKSIREDNVKRTRTQIRRLVNCNTDMTKFLTLTFDSEMTSLTKANKLFNEFIKRLSRLYSQLKYVAIPEFQGDKDFFGNVKPNGGSVHYHILLNLPFVPSAKIEKIWQNGFIKVKKINNIDNVGAYVCKYLGKENFDARFFKKKKFFRSMNLAVSVIVDKFDELKKNLAFFIPDSMILKFESSFLSKWLGVVQYKQYNLYS